MAGQGKLPGGTAATDGRGGDAAGNVNAGHGDAADNGKTDPASGPDIALRPMRLIDIPTIVKMELACFPDDPWPFEAFEHEIINDYSQPQVVRDRDGRIVGYMIVWFMGPEVHIANIAVDPEMRGHGLGRAMMESAIEKSRDAGAEEMVLEVRVTNVPAIALYKSLGFVPVYIRKNYYRSGEDAVVMSLLL